jgi:hypothetical protein
MYHYTSDPLLGTTSLADVWLTDSKVQFLIESILNAGTQIKKLGTQKHMANAKGRKSGYALDRIV